MSAERYDAWELLLTRASQYSVIRLINKGKKDDNESR